MKCFYLCLSLFLVSSYVVNSEEIAPIYKDAIKLAGEKPHPRLIFTEEVENKIKETLKTDENMRLFLKLLEEKGQNYLSTQPIKYKLVGIRLLKVSREVLNRVTTLAVLHRLKGGTQYLKRLEAEMLNAASFLDWNPKHYLDTAEMTAALALGYDWVYQDISAKTRKKIEKSIYQKAFETYRPFKRKSNWNDVCNGGMIVGTLALADIYPKMAENILALAVTTLPQAYATYSTEGAHIEGGSYWKYASLYSVLALDSLDTACNTDFGLLKKYPNFMKGAYFYGMITTPTGGFFNYADAKSVSVKIFPQLFWYAQKTKNQDILYIYKPIFNKLIKEGIGVKNRVFPLSLFWWENFEKLTEPQQKIYLTNGYNPIATLRSSFKESNASFIGIKGGKAKISHGHMDAGSFIFESDGVRWGIDLGSQSYITLEKAGIKLWKYDQYGERWKIFRLNAFSHNTLTIDGNLHNVNGKAVFTKHGKNYAILNLTSVFDPFEHAQRGFYLFQNRQALIQDEFKMGEQDGTIRWAMMTNASVKLKGNKAILSQDGKQLTLKVISPKKAKLEIYQTDIPVNKYDAPNPNTRMIGFKVRAKAKENKRLVVLLKPKSTYWRLTPKLKSLSSWK